MLMGEPLDVIAIGRSSVDLYGAQVGGRLEDVADARAAIEALTAAPGTFLAPAPDAASRVAWLDLEEIALTAHGKGTNTRHINNIAMKHDDWCDSLLVAEILTPADHRSSHPSRRHDEDDFPRLTYLGETYYHSINPVQGFGVQRVYNHDGRLDETMAVSDGVVVLARRGHNPCAAPYGFGMCYLNVTAGPLRRWRFVPDPAVE